MEDGRHETAMGIIDDFDGRNSSLTNRIQSFFAGIFKSVHGHRYTSNNQPLNPIQYERSYSQISNPGNSLETHSESLAVKLWNESSVNLAPVSTDINDNNRTRMPEVSTNRRKLLGTVDGVFIPTWISIWGILVFVRLPYVIGYAGILQTLAMFIIGYFVALVTALSISAIGTNGIVLGGGPYFMISRTLGVEFGVCIAVIIVISNLLGNAMNIFGFVEPFLVHQVETLPDMSMFWLSTLVLACCTFVCYFGAKLFARASSTMFIIIAGCTLMLFFTFLFRPPILDSPSPSFTSWNWDTFRENLFSNYTNSISGVNDESFNSLFAVIYPSCTGILAGASLSGDLKDPRQSIPFGTLLAIGVSFISYLLLTFCIGATIPRAALQSSYKALYPVAWPSFIVPVAVSTAAIFATISGILTSAKILQAISHDRIIPLLNVFARGRRDDEPFIAITAVWFMSQLLLFSGDLNSIVPFITIFALLTYGIINFACFLLKLTGAPNFRPGFVYFTALSAFLGFLACIGCMFVVSALDAALATIFLIILWICIHFTAPPKSWGDIQQALIYHQVRKYLLRLDSRKDHVKYWRPQILLLTMNQIAPLSLIDFANSMKKGSLYIVGDVIVDTGSDSSVDLLKQRTERLNDLQQMVDALQVKAFVETNIDTFYTNGSRSLILNCGLGGMKPNILLLPYLESDHSATRIYKDFTSIVHTAYMLGKSVAVARGFEYLDQIRSNSNQPATLFNPLSISGMIKRLLGPPSGEISVKFIDVYPFMIGHDFATFAMTLQLACILHLVDKYSEPLFTLRMISVVEKDSLVEWERHNISRLLNDLRIKCKILVVSLESIGVSLKSAISSNEYDIKINLPEPAIPTSRIANNKVPVFGELDFKSQLKVLNRVFHVHSHPHQTSVLFTCMPMPKDVALDNNKYLDVLDALSFGSDNKNNTGQREAYLNSGIPPVMMVFGQGIVVTRDL